MGHLLPREAKKHFRQRGFAEGEIVTRWREIAGSEFSRFTMPIRLSYKRGENRRATLHLLVEGAFASHVQHLSPLIIEKVNMFYGYETVAKINIHQGRVKDRESNVYYKPEPAPPEIKDLIKTLVDSTHDERLKEALRSLGESVLVDKK